MAGSTVNLSDSYNTCTTGIDIGRYRPWSSCANCPCTLRPIEHNSASNLHASIPSHLCSA